MDICHKSSIIMEIGQVDDRSILKNSTNYYRDKENDNYFRGKSLLENWFLLSEIMAILTAIVWGWKYVLMALP